MRPWSAGRRGRRLHLWHPSSAGIALATAVDGWSDLALGGRAAGRLPGRRDLGRQRRESSCRSRIRVRAASPTAIPASTSTWGPDWPPPSWSAVWCSTGTTEHPGRSATTSGPATTSTVLTGERSSRISCRGSRCPPVAESVCERPVSAADVFAAVPTDPRMASLVVDFVGELAFHLVNLTNAVDPQRIVVGGGMTAAWPLVHPALRTALDRAVPYPPELVRSASPDCAPLIGAIALGARAAASRRRSRGIRAVTTHDSSIEKGRET